MKYNKYMETIKITHYLNKKLKPIDYGSGNAYPVYIRVLYGREVMRFKSILLSEKNKISELPSYYTDEDFENIDEIKPILEREKEIIKYLLENKNTFEKIDIPKLVFFFADKFNDILSIIKIKNYNHIYNIQSDFINYIIADKNIDKRIFYESDLLRDLEFYFYLDNFNFIKNEKDKNFAEFIKLLLEYDKLYLRTDEEKEEMQDDEELDLEFRISIFDWLIKHHDNKFHEYAKNKFKDTEMLKSIFEDIHTEIIWRINLYLSNN